jgi:iron complex outermembrane receptor protein
VNGSEVSLQAYFDQSHVAGNGVRDRESIGNIDFQHHLSIGSRNDVVWGLGYRAAANRFRGNGLTSLNPLQRTDSLSRSLLNNEAKQGRAGPWMSVAGGITGSLGGCGDAATGLE